MTVRAYALNAKTFAITHELPFSSLQVNNVISGIGTWSMELPVSFKSPDGVEIMTAENLSTNRTLVAIVSDGSNIMLGLFNQETGEYNEDTESFRLGGPEAALGYMDRRVWMDGRTTHTAEDLFTIANDLVFQSDFLGLGQVIWITYEPSSGVAGASTTVTFDLTDRKSLYEYLKDLSSLNGFEFMGYMGGSQSAGFTPGILLGYPSIYRRTGFVLELGKNVSRLAYTIDGKSYANLVYFAGGKRGQYAPLRNAVYGPDLASTPYMTRFGSVTDVLDDTTLQQYADRMLQVSRTPPRRIDVVVDHQDPDCRLGSFRLGDEFRLVANRGRLAVDSFFRVESWSLDVTADGAEEVKMSLFETGTM